MHIYLLITQKQGNSGVPQGLFSTPNIWGSWVRAKKFTLLEIEGVLWGIEGREGVGGRV